METGRSIRKCEYSQARKIHHCRICGKQISILRDLQLFRQHFLEISPEDKIEIENLITYIKAFENISMPSEKPFDLMNVWEIIKFVRSMKNSGKVLKYLSHISIEEFCSSFKSPLIKKVLGSIMPAKYSASSLIFTLASFIGGNSDLPMGGSRAMVERIVEKYISLGGKVKTNAEIEEILIDDGVAKGVQMADGNKEFASYIIPACDIDITYNKLLGGKYKDKKFVKRYSNPDKYPLSSCVYLSFAVDAKLEAYPENFVFESSPFTCGEKTYHKITMHHYCYDNFAPKGKSIVISTISTDEDDYIFWKSH